MRWASSKLKRCLEEIVVETLHLNFPLCHPRCHHHLSHRSFGKELIGQVNQQSCTFNVCYQRKFMMRCLSVHQFHYEIEKLCCLTEEIFCFVVVIPIVHGGSDVLTFRFSDPLLTRGQNSRCQRLRFMYSAHRMKMQWWHRQECPIFLPDAQIMQVL